MDLGQLILKLALQDGKIKTSEVVKKLHNTKSRQHVNSVLRDMVKKKLLLKGGTTAGAFYVLPRNSNLIGQEITIKLKRENLEEHKVFSDLKDKTPFISDLKENISSIVFYAFTEMLNNAIDHSQSKKVNVYLKCSNGNFEFGVTDQESVTIPGPGRVPCLRNGDALVIRAGDRKLTDEPVVRQVIVEHHRVAIVIRLAHAAKAGPQ